VRGRTAVTQPDAWRWQATLAGSTASSPGFRSGAACQRPARREPGPDIQWRLFRRPFAGQPDLGYLYCTQEFPDGDFDLADGASAEADFATFAAERAATDESVRGRSLDDTFYDPNPAEPIGLRWIYLHLIEEYARHNGHADILRVSVVTCPPRPEGAPAAR
jgi:hypothetical protein